MTGPLRFRTLVAPVTFAAPPVKKSRFVGLAAPTTDEDDARATIDQAASRWPDARHHCWAWRLPDDRARSTDDGEPGGSAGRPILAQIEGHGLHGVVVVVVRWFGGIKLGVGGLIRAYGGTAGQTLDRGEVVEVGATTEVVVRHSYDDTGAVQAVLATRGIEVLDTTWDAAVEVVLRLDVEQLDGVRDALRDATAGRVTATERA